MPGLHVDRIDPRAETERYIAKIMAQRGASLDAQGQALLREDLASPCTEEVAVFHAFSHIVAEARSAFVVLDTAPTGHSLLLMDATGAYHRQMVRQSALQDRRAHHDAADAAAGSGTDAGSCSWRWPKPRRYREASALQDDLRRAEIEPYGWIINKSLAAAGTHDPLLRLRLARERTQIARVRNGLAKQAYMVGWRSQPPIGVAELQTMS